MEVSYYKCLVPDCESNLVYSEHRLLALHYGRDHEGIEVPNTHHHDRGGSRWLPDSIPKKK